MNHCPRHLILLMIVAMLAALLQPCTAAAEDPASEPDATVYVSDLANVLSGGLEASITARSEALDALTGAQLVVVTVDFLGGEAIQDYADNLFTRLKIGDAVKNNGLLLLLATGEDNYYALQGKGLENDLTDKALETLLQEDLEPDFAAGNYETGVQKTYDALLEKLEGIYGIDDQGVLTAAAEAKAAQIKIEKSNRRKQGLLVAAGIVLLILLPTVLLAAATSGSAHRRRKRRKVVARQRADD